MTEEKQPVTLRSTISATFAGIFRGTDPSLVFLGLFTLLGVIVCTSLTIWTPWGALGTIVFLLCFVFILLSWKLGSDTRSALDHPSTQLSVRSGEHQVDISIPLGDKLANARWLLTRMREIVQVRQIPPAPNGEVLGTPADEKSLHEYSPEERSKVEQQWAEEIPQHDRQIIEQLTSSVRALEALSAEAESGTIEGLRQNSTTHERQSKASNSTISEPNKNSSENRVT